MSNEHRPSNWLIGTWRSDKERTVAAWGDYPPGPPKFQEIMLRELGLLEIRFTAKRMLSLNGDLETRVPYRVIWESKSAAVVIYGRQGEECAQHIQFGSPMIYWVQTGRFWEYFAKVKER